ncbi:hypothetical protein [Mesorhizobium shangrilense]|uniref:Uncharacterized protein n=1 Tax=Mesorhizobium shangrilense TaxID=460060 RepID=A0ABV2DRA6_9HYPH
MSRQRVVINSVVLALAAGTFSLTTNADAAVVKHHLVHHVAARHDTGHRHVVRRYVRTGIPAGGVWTDDDWVADNGWIGGYNNGYGDYGRHGDDYCGPIQWTIDRCYTYAY